jgi:hypothetical protein
MVRDTRFLSKPDIELMVRSWPLSIHLCLRTSPNLKSAKNFSSCKCPNVVRRFPDGMCSWTSAHVYLFTVEVLAVPKNMKLLAIPLFELYDNAAR